MRKIIVINAKGGCGKTTIATNLASYYAAKGLKTTLYDYDPQGSSMLWLQQRADEQTAIHGIAAYERNTGITRAWQLKPPSDVERIVVDTPACVHGHDLHLMLKGVDTVLIPMLPSVIDTQATINFIEELKRIGKSQLNQMKIYIIANRVNPRTKTFKAMKSAIEALDIPVLAYLRDTIDYVSASDMGMGIHELNEDDPKGDAKTWIELINHIEEGDTLVAGLTNGSSVTDNRVASYH